ncbi:hypothetical protein D1BOALGB6SA_1631 [Olavius sp. associated proteobacterium Delta 1]|nr:hypothetical protein D1BOALGB6SA_1631 [Olavius sp. associated proteobacterium Delta 1]
MGQLFIKFDRRTRNIKDFRRPWSRYIFYSYRYQSQNQEKEISRGKEI